ncbi:MAG: hypothetical protein EXR64_05390 [Dehalococcoidia bacterium]|nr:hypothetical protein [Dehalococcoidia bacterium]
MLREETFAELLWDDGRAISGLIVVWSGEDDREEFQAWLLSVRRAIPRFYELPPGMEALANGAPWRGLFIAPWSERLKGGGQGPVTLLFRGFECRAISLQGRATTRPFVTAASDEGSIEYQLLGLPTGVNPCTV